MWDIISKILNGILGLMTVYLYLENRKLKGLEIDKEIEIKRIEIAELKNEYLKDQENIKADMARRGLTFSGIRTKIENVLRVKYDNKIDKKKAELTYLEKLKKYKWIFSK